MIVAAAAISQVLDAATEENEPNPRVSARASVTPTLVSRTGAAETAQALVEATPNALIPMAQPLFGPVAGSLIHGEGGINNRAAQISITNFIAEAVFTAPYSSLEGPWDYGFFFRWTGASQQYRLSVGSDGRWTFGFYDGNVTAVPGTSRSGFANLKTDGEATNTLRIVVWDKQAWFYLNDAYVTALDVSTKVTAGDVRVATGFFQGRRIAGRATRYEGFEVSSLPLQGELR